MKQKMFAGLIPVMIISIVLFACKQKKKTDETTKNETTSVTTETPAITGFDPAMDATKMAGYPAKILGDTLNMKAYEFLANPGDTIPLHSHPDHIIYVTEGGTAEIKGKDGKAQVAEFKTGSCMILGPDSHSAINTGTTALKLFIVHVYRPRS